MINTFCLFPGLVPVCNMSSQHGLQFPFERLLLVNAESGPLYTCNDVTYVRTEAQNIETKIHVLHNEISIAFYGKDKVGFAVWYQKHRSHELERIFPIEDGETQCIIEHLNPGTKYNIFVVKYKNGKKISVTTTSATTTICGPPVHVALEKGKTDIRLAWDDPSEIAAGLNITGYTLKIANYSSPCRSETIFYNQDRKSLVLQLSEDSYGDRVLGNGIINPNNSYVFTLHAHCGKYIGTQVKHDNLLPKHRFLSKSKPCRIPGKTIYQLNHTINQPTSDITNVTIENKKSGIGKYISEKVILLFGQSGSGKTTWINSIINHILNVKFEDDFRFKLELDSAPNTQSESPRPTITIYKMYNERGMNISFPLTIIDTPGFGDRVGMEKGKEIEKQLNDLLKNHVGHVNAIAFVAASSTTRLTYTQRYVLDSFQRIFTPDIRENVFVLSTFADRGIPPLKGVIDHHLEFECNNFFPFCNSAFFPCSEPVPYDTESEPESNFENPYGEYNEMFWELGNKNFAEFIKVLESTPAISLTLNKGTLRERQHIETETVVRHSVIKKLLVKFDQMQNEDRFLDFFQTELSPNTGVSHFKKIPIPDNQNTTTCSTCNRTCHADCVIANDEDKWQCCVMDSDRKCTKCSKRCFWDKHKNAPYIIVWDDEDEWDGGEGQEGVASIYDQDAGIQYSMEELREARQRELRGIATQIKCAMSEIVQGLARLQKTTVPSSPLTQEECIDLFIATECEEASLGWAQRVKGLKMIREEAKTISQISHDTYDPFVKYREEAEKARKLSRNMDDISVWYDISTIVDRREDWKKKQGSEI